MPSPSATPTPPARDPSDREPAPGDGLLLDWPSIRTLATLFDKIGDDVLARRRESTSLSSTSGLVGGDDEGRKFAEWYVDGFDSVAEAMGTIAERNFVSGMGLRSFEKLWDWVEQEIINQLPVIPDVPAAPIPQAPPRKEGA